VSHHKAESLLILYCGMEGGFVASFDLSDAFRRRRVRATFSRKGVVAEF
jgi:hypothetical protein